MTSKYRRLDYRDYSIRDLVSALDTLIIDTFEEYRRSRVRTDDVQEIRHANRQRETLRTLLRLRAEGLGIDSQYALAWNRSVWRNAGPEYNRYLEPFWRTAA